MLNQVILVGRPVGRVEFKQEVGATMGTILVEVERNFKNGKEEYDVDIVPVKLYRGLADSFEANASWVSLVGIKGRLVMTESGIGIIAEKLSFLQGNE